MLSPALEAAPSAEEGSPKLGVGCYLRLERAMGFEPTTSSLGSWHSTTELRPPQIVSLDRLKRSSWDAATGVVKKYCTTLQEGIPGMTNQRKHRGQLTK